jgi:hypothetical protein
VQQISAGEEPVANADPAPGATSSEAIIAQVGKVTESNGYTDDINRFRAMKNQKYRKLNVTNPEQLPGALVALRVRLFYGINLIIHVLLKFTLFNACRFHRKSWNLNLSRL